MTIKKRKNTPFDELLAKYDISRSELISKMVGFKMNDYEGMSEYKKIKSRLSSQIHKYAAKKAMPPLPILIRIATTVGCGMEELLLSLKTDKALLELLPSLRLDRYIMSPEDMKLLREGYEFSIPQLHVDYRINAEASYLIISQHFIIKPYKKLLGVEDLFYNNMSYNYTMIDCENAYIDVVPGSQDKFFSVTFGKYMIIEVGKEIEFTINFFYSGIKIEEDSYFTIRINHPTKLLKLTGLFQRLNSELKKIRCRQYNSSNNYKSNKNLVEAKDISLGKDKSFILTFDNPPVDSVFELDWRGLTKTVKQLV